MKRLVCRASVKQNVIQHQNVLSSRHEISIRIVVSKNVFGILSSFFYFVFFCFIVFLFFFSFSSLFFLFLLIFFLLFSVSPKLVSAPLLSVIYALDKMASSMKTAAPVHVKNPRERNLCSHLDQSFHRVPRNASQMRNAKVRCQRSHVCAAAQTHRMTSVKERVYQQLQVAKFAERVWK